MPTHKKGHDKDKYYQLAKDQGYRSRAAFKLIQINKRYGFLTKAKVLIDLCAAPGGWCQVAQKFMPPGSIILGVDLLPIKAIRGCKTIIGDITTSKCRQDIVGELQGWKADVVLCDGAPNIGSAYNKDAFVQNELVLAALKTATDHLTKGGVFCTKVYRSVDYNSLVWVLQQIFDDVQTMKPNSSRSQSSEIFLVCMGYTSPKSIDSKLFDPNHVFKEVSDPGLKRPDVLHKKFESSNKRQRTGYDESLGIALRKTVSVTDFITSQDAVRILTDAHEITFSESCEKFRAHPKTSEEVMTALSDLRVLGKIDFKKLLKWRQILRDEFFPSEVTKVSSSRVLSETSQNISSDEAILNEIEVLRSQNEVAKKKELKKLRKIQSKERLRKTLGMSNSAFEVDDDQELFALDPSMTADDVDLLADVQLDNDETLELAMQAGGYIKNKIEADNDVSKSNAIFIQNPDLEDELEEDYVNFLDKRRKRQGGKEVERTFSSKAFAKTLSPEAQLQDIHNEDAETLTVFNNNLRQNKSLTDLHNDLEHYLNMLSGKKDRKKSGKNNEEDSESTYGSSEESDDHESDSESVHSNEIRRNKFMVSKGANKLDFQANKWFANPIFTGNMQNLAGLQSSSNSLDEHLSEDKVFDYMPKTDKERRKEKRKRDQDRKARRQSKHVVDNSDSESSVELPTRSNRSKENERETVEIVPIDSTLDNVGMSVREDKRTYDSDEEDYDQHDKMMTLALGTYMLRSSRTKALVDASYNRFSWNDPSNLPAWFMDDEIRHNKPQVPVPSALIEQIQNKYQLTGTKVIKKVAEARARKKKRATQKLKAAKKQASLMADNNDLSEKQKLKIIAKASRVNKTEKSKKVYVATKKTQQGSIGTSTGSKGGKMKFVDKRLKKDNRAKKARQKRGKR